MPLKMDSSRPQWKFSLALLPSSVPFWNPFPYGRPWPSMGRRFLPSPPSFLAADALPVISPAVLPPSSVAADLRQGVHRFPLFAIQ